MQEERNGVCPDISCDVVTEEWRKLVNSMRRRDYGCFKQTQIELRKTEAEKS